MSLKTIINKISNHREIISAPPVLIDIGASKEINRYWKRIAHFSICIAFDADDRKFEYISSEDSIYKKLITINKIVVAKSGSKKEDFYLTQSPYCSSLLEPDLDSLQKFHYSILFEVKDKRKIETVELTKVLTDLSIDYIDWFKTDSQGTDLRLFKSLNDSIQKKTIVLEIEPGFIDAYKGEDKILDCLNFLSNKKEFYLTRFNVKGPLRIPHKSFDAILNNSLQKKIASLCYKSVPGWAEITCMNDFNRPDTSYSLRDYILAWLFSTLQGQNDIAYVYAHTALGKFAEDDLLFDLKSFSTRKLKLGVFSLRTAGNFLKILQEKYL